MILSNVFKGVITNLKYQKKFQYLDETISARKKETRSNINLLYDHHDIEHIIPTESLVAPDEIAVINNTPTKEKHRKVTKIKLANNHKKTKSDISNCYSNQLKKHIQLISSSPRKKGNESLPQIITSMKASTNICTNITNNHSFSLKRKRNALSPLFHINDFKLKCDDVTVECNALEQNIIDCKPNKISKSCYYLSREQDKINLHKKDIECLKKTKHIKEIKEYYMMQKKAQLLQESKIIQKNRNHYQTLSTKELMNNLFTLEGKRYLTSIHQDNILKRTKVTKDVERIEKLLNETTIANNKITNTLAEYINHTNI